MYYAASGSSPAGGRLGFWRSDACCQPIRRTELTNATAQTRAADVSRSLRLDVRDNVDFLETCDSKRAYSLPSKAFEPRKRSLCEKRPRHPGRWRSRYIRSESD